MKPTPEQVIAWAREARLLRVTETYTEPHRWGLTEISRLAALAYEAGRKDEREACAKVCEELLSVVSTGDAQSRRQRQYIKPECVNEY